MSYSLKKYVKKCDDSDILLEIQANMLEGYRHWAGGCSLVGKILA